MYFPMRERMPRFSISIRNARWQSVGCSVYSSCAPSIFMFFGSSPLYIASFRSLKGYLRLPRAEA